MNAPRRVIAAFAAVAIASASLTPNRAHAEPITATALLILGAKALKLFGLGSLPVVGASAAKTAAITATMRSVAVMQATRITAYRGLVTVSQNTVTVASHVSGGLQINGAQIARGAIRGLLGTAGVTAASGSAVADDTVAGELALARARGETSFRQLVCVRSDRTLYAVPSETEQCLRSGEELKVLEQPLNPQMIR